MTTVTIKPAVPEITRVVVERPAQPEQVVLTMDRKTAEVLQLVTCVIGGAPSTTLRGEVDKIRNALNAAGVREFGRKANEYSFQATERVLSGGITFRA